MSCPSLVRPSNASCWPITCGGKKVKQPSIFKLTQHINNWEVSILFFKCIVFFVVDVPPPGYERIYNILPDDNRYDMTIGNFLGCSSVYFAAMLKGSLGGLKTCAM